MFHLERGGTSGTHDKNDLLVLHVLVDLRLVIVLLRERLIDLFHKVIHVTLSYAHVVHLVPGTSVPRAFHNRKQ